MPEATLGEQLRRSRRSMGLTLRELAAKVGLSPSLLSQVENGRTRLSAGNLELLMNALDIAPSDLFVTRNGVALDAAEPTPVPVHEDIVVPGTAGGVINRVGTRPSRAMAGGLAMERLPTSVGHLLDPLLMTYPPGASSAFEGLLLRHPGMEIGYIIDGVLTLQLSFDTYELRAGDSLHFDSTIPHVYTNTSDAPATGLWIMVGDQPPSAPRSGEPTAVEDYHWSAGTA